MGSSGRTTISTPAPSEEERQLTARQVELAELQLEATRRQTELAAPAFEQERLRQQIRGEIFTPEQIRSDLLRQIRREETLGTVQDQLLAIELERIQAGGGATQREKDLIAESTNQALALGGSDLQQAAIQGIDLIKNELAPSLGLRPEDTPIIDRGGQIVTEGLRQFGQLERSLRGAQATAELNFPLARDQALAAQSGFTQQLGQSAAEFQRALQGQASNNRARLLGLGTVGGLGLQGASAQGLSILQQGRQVNTRTSGRQSQNFGGALVSVLSSKLVKDLIGPLHPEDVLEELRDMDVDIWKYKGDDRVHVGPYAEDFKDAFGLGGDGTEIAVIDAIGILMAAVKGLIHRTEALDGV